MTRRPVIIGPNRQLLAIHRSLVRDAPPNVRYAERDALHVFVHQQRRFRPHAHPSVAEFADFGEGSELVHSWRLPVLNRSSWVADFEGFAIPVLIGRNSLDPGLRRDFRRRWSKRFVTTLRQRGLSMLRAYAHPSCKAVLFFTQVGLQGAERWIERLELGDAGAAFLEKASVLHPAQPAISREAVERKWARADRLRVLFCGIDFERKNGALALELFDRLARVHPRVHFTYVGRVPVGLSLPSRTNFEFHRELPRSRVLALCRRAHVLFHPARTESFGMILLEAAAAGAAVMTGCGPGMRHTREIFDDRSAVLVEDPKELAPALESLLAHPERTKAIGRRAHRLLERSVDRRNTKLERIYERALRTPSAPIAFTGGSRVKGLSIRTMTSQELGAMERRHREKLRVEELNIYL